MSKDASNRNSSTCHSRCSDLTSPAREDARPTRVSLQQMLAKQQNLLDWKPDKRQSVSHYTIKPVSISRVGVSQSFHRAVTAVS